MEICFIMLRYLMLFAPIGFLLLVPSASSQNLVSILEKDVSIDEKKYLIYDINHGEGFNLRRDVFLRIANTVKILRKKGHNYVLVLPPWGGLFHWSRGQIRVPWSRFFDLNSMKLFVPVIEFADFLHEVNYNAIDEVVYLQAYAEGWISGKYETKYDLRECIDGNKYYKFNGRFWEGWFFAYNGVVARNFTCMSMQGDSEVLAEMIIKNYSNVEILMIDRAEVVLHAHFGDVFYWQARRSMRYAEHLRKIGDQFRQEVLSSNDTIDRTKLLNSWKAVEKKHGDALGGDYLCIHWRRRDFVRSHGADIPSIKGTAKQINEVLDKKSLSKVFLSTDASKDEVNALRKHLLPTAPIVQFLNRSGLNDGEVSIIDQWICAHARYFIGTHSSTFSYRIQEDREILGFKPETTFNRLCPDGDNKCEQPAKWTIVY